MPKAPPQICVIPDTQVKPGHAIDHFDWLCNYLLDKRPGYVVHIGDHFDLPSLSSYDKGKRSFEGRRLRDDIAAGRAAMDRLTKGWDKAKYKPVMVYTLGNHDDRLTRLTNDSPELHGSFSLADLGLERNGWRVMPFLQPVTLFGIEFVHYVCTGVKGLPASSAAAMMKHRQCSVVQGHVQRREIYIHPSTGQTAIMAGLFYPHKENYLGPQGNNCEPAIWFLNECRDGLFDPMVVSLAFLKRRYS